MKAHEAAKPSDGRASGAGGSPPAGGVALPTIRRSDMSAINGRLSLLSGWCRAKHYWKRQRISSIGSRITGIMFSVWSRRASHGAYSQRRF